MSTKRAHVDIDPDYEDVSDQQNKRQKVLEEGAKAATKRKIESIIRKQFQMEIANKEAEVVSINEKLEMSRSMIDRLRACIVANYYGNASQQKSRGKAVDQVPSFHPTVKKYIGKAPPGTPSQPAAGGAMKVKQETTETVKSETAGNSLGSERIGVMASQVKESAQTNHVPQKDANQSDTRTGRFKVKRRIIVGNVSKSIPADERDENDQATHKWMVYVRGPKEEPRIDHFVKKVWFFLHPSYRPNDLVEVSQTPFHLTRRGWGEFPVRVQLHFKDQRNKKLDIVHHLKLDRTYTGLQTLGRETVVDIELERDISELRREKRQKAASRDANVTSHNVNITAEVKQEPDAQTEDSASQVQAGSGSSLLKEIKVEPVDHDYGRTGSSTIASAAGCIPVNSGQLLVPVKLEAGMGTGSVMAGCSMPVSLASPVQTVVNPSIITTQVLTALPSGSPGLQTLNLVRVMPSTEQTVSSSKAESVVAKSKNCSMPSAPRNVVLQGFGSLSTANLMASKSAVNRPPGVETSSNKFVAGSSNLSGPQSLVNPNLQVANQLLIQTSPQAVGAQPAMQNKPGNQSTSGLVFLKCTDNQGKTYLIPQQLCTSLSPAKASNSVRVTTPVSQPLLLTSPTQSSQSLVRIPLAPISSPAKNKLQNVPNVGVQSRHSLQTVSPNIAVAQPRNILQTASPTVALTPRQPIQNGPLLFIKPGAVLNKTSQSVNQSRSVAASSVNMPVRVSSATNFQTVMVTSASGSKTASNVKLVNPVLMPLETTASAGTGQLKVTSQGLIHIQGDASGTSALKKCVSKTESVTVNGDGPILPSAPPPKQPIILMSKNNKHTFMPTKAKSLLSPVVNNSLMSVAQSNGNIVLVNNTSSVLANGNAMNVTSSYVVANQNKATDVTGGKQSLLKSNTAKADAGSGMLVLQAKHPQTSTTSPPNHLVIVPVTSEQNVSMVSTCQSNSQMATMKLSTSDNNNKAGADQKFNDKTMFIVVQNDKHKNNTTPSASSVSQHQPGSSLLGSRSQAMTSSSVRTDFSETKVMVSSKNSSSKRQVIVVNQQDADVKRPPREDGPREKKIISLDPKKKKLRQVEVKETIPQLCLSDYHDIASLIKAAVLRHPLVSETAARHLHPYCAKSRDDWLSWNVGKRRASEWQRCSSVRRFIMPYLDDGKTYKGESLWATKQILTWCRLHAYSPHYLERPLHPTAIDLQAETSLPSDKQHKKFSSVSGSDQLVQEMAALELAADGTEEEVDIVSVERPTAKVKVKTEDPDVREEIEYLPLTDGALFVEETAKQIGVRLQPTEVEPGYHGAVPHGVLYKAMELMMEDVLREMFALQVNMGRYPDTLGIADAYNALRNLPITDFLTNKHLGVEENKSNPFNR